MDDMTHNTEFLIASERERWLKLRLEVGLSMAEVAERSGFARSTLYLWRDAYEKDGLVGLIEKSRVHHAHPKPSPPEMVALTDHQFGKMEVFYGKKPRESEEIPEQILLF
jgi:transposase-like protein